MFAAGNIDPPLLTYLQVLPAFLQPIPCPLSAPETAGFMSQSKILEMSTHIWGCLCVHTNRQQEAVERSQKQQEGNLFSGLALKGIVRHQESWRPLLLNLNSPGDTAWPLCVATWAQLLLFSVLATVCHEKPLNLSFLFCKVGLRRPPQRIMPGS